jgi:polyhydroxybutyrate depolymerase
MLSKYHAHDKSKLFGAGIHRGLLRLFIAFILTSIQPAAAQLEARPLTHNGYLRPYLIFRPAHLSPHPAVVFMLGGIRSTAKSEAEDYGWMEQAERNGFLAVFPEPVATRPGQSADRKNNVTFWEMKGSRTHLLAPGKLPVDDDGYLSAVLHDVLHRDHSDRKRIYIAGFSSGSGMVQLFASRHSQEISGVVAVATPLMDPPAKLQRPVPILYIHGDDDEQFSGFETNNPHFATTPHGNWITWGYLDGCHTQIAERTAWGVRFSWRECRNEVPVIADFVAHLGHEWAGSLDAHYDQKYWPSGPPNFTDLAWRFFAGLPSK